MNIRKTLAASALACMTGLVSSTAMGQAYPEKVIQIITSGAGGSSDISSRIIAEGMKTALGQPVIVDNRTGLQAILSVVKAPADGYTLLYYGGVIWNEPLLRKDAGWDAQRDLSPVILSMRAPNLLTVHPSVPVRNVAEFIALAKSKPGALNYAAAGQGSSSHLAAEVFKFMAGVNLQNVFYKNTGTALADVIGGRVQVLFASPLGVAGALKAGQLKALAVTSANPTPLAPGLPTVAAGGVPGYEYGTEEGMFAPAKTPDARINRLFEVISQYLLRPEIKEKFFVSGAEIVAGTPQQTTALIRTQVERLDKMIKSGNLALEQ